MYVKIALIISYYIVTLLFCFNPKGLNVFFYFYHNFYEKKLKEELSHEITILGLGASISFPVFSAIDMITEYFFHIHYMHGKA